MTLLLFQRNYIVNVKRIKAIKRKINVASFIKINEADRKLKSSIKLKNTKAPFPIVADMFAQKRLCRITVKVLKNVGTRVYCWLEDAGGLHNSIRGLKV